MKGHDLSITQIHPRNTPFSLKPELQLDAGNAAPLNAR
jgi:hypothetical protein